MSTEDTTLAAHRARKVQAYREAKTEEDVQAVANIFWYSIISAPPLLFLTIVLLLMILWRVW